MGNFLKIFYESIIQAFQQLGANKLRSFLSLLGICIGIFCIIAVMAAVDSLQENIEGSFQKLGNDVLYIDKMPWNEPPHQSWWKYNKRPEPDHDDYKALKKFVKGSDKASLAIFVPGKTIKYRSNNVGNAYLIGATYDYSDIFNIDIEKGRYYSQFEFDKGLNKAVLGATVAEELFGALEPIGKEIRIYGQKYQVIGVIKKEGNSLISVVQFDEAVLISFNSLKKLINVKTNRTYGTSLNIKAAQGVSLDQLEDQVTGVLRSERKLKPREESDFALNRLSIITNALGSVFSVLHLIGWVIGGFALIVGMFSVANIMFVSVKERTSIIGIKKALGAKKSVILLEFLIESIVLCFLGSLLGLAIVYGSLKLISKVFEYDMFLSANNVILAVVMAVIIGIVSGLIPALQAARMDPVEAIRH